MLHRFAVPVVAALLSVGFAAVAMPASAAPAKKQVASASKHCRSKNGKYVACARNTHAKQSHAKQCRDSKGHFSECSG